MTNCGEHDLKTTENFATGKKRIWAIGSKNVTVGKEFVSTHESYECKSSTGLLGKRACECSLTRFTTYRLTRLESTQASA